MPQVIEITCPPIETPRILERLRAIEGVVGITLERGISLEPPGDVVSVKTTNSGAGGVLDAVGTLAPDRGVSVMSTEPRSMIAPEHFSLLDRETNEVSWEAVAAELRKESNPEFNFFLLMAMAGAMAAVGLWVDLVHIVVGAMVVAPGFEPLLRIPFGALVRMGSMTSRGLAAVAGGYLALAVAAGLLLAVLRLVDPSASTILQEGFWVGFWSTPTAEGTVLALVAGAAGATTVTAGRSVLTAGVMIALALVPAMAIAGMAAVATDFPLFLDALTVWAINAAAVVVVGGVVFFIKDALFHRRRALG